MANISKIKLPSGVTYNVVDNTSGYITGYTETDPVFSASAAAGITSTDISNWGYAYNGYNSLQWNDTRKALRASKQGSMVTLFEQSDMAYDSASNTTGFLTISDIPSWARASTKPTYTANEVGALPDTTTIPTKTSDLTNDSGFVTTDEKLSTTLASDGWHCLLLGTASSTASTKYYSTGLKCSISSTSVWLSLGTNSSDGPEGELTLYGKGKKGVDISVPNNLTKNVAVKLPSAEGTLALIEDIPTVPTNVSDLVNDSGYITGISSSDVTTALGYTPYNSTNPNGYTSNTGTITGITMNGSSKGISGVVNLGTVVTDVFLDGTSVVSSGTAELTSATLTASDDGNGNVTLGLTGIGALSTASGVSF